MDPTDLSPWRTDWVWSLPLIATTVAIHCFGLSLVWQRVTRFAPDGETKHFSSAVSALIVGGAAIYAATLHGIEGAIWAVTYRWLGALPDRKSAMLYSLGAMTTQGGAGVHLQAHWRLMGSLEALDGWILFGITTAFLLTIMQKLLLHGNSFGLENGPKR